MSVMCHAITSAIGVSATSTPYTHASASCSRRLEPVRDEVTDGRAREVARELRGERGDEQQRRRVGGSVDPGSGQHRRRSDGEPGASEKADHPDRAQLPSNDVRQIREHEREHHDHRRERRREREEQRHERELARHGEAVADVELRAQGHDQRQEARDGRGHVPGAHRGRKQDQQRRGSGDEAATDDELRASLGRGERVTVTLERLSNQLLFTQARFGRHAPEIG